jgi:hypothetical protein
MFIKKFDKKFTLGIVGIYFSYSEIQLLFPFFWEKIAESPLPPLNLNYAKTLLRMYHKNLVIWGF